MVAITTVKNDPTLDAIDRALVEFDQSQPKRTYLGASTIGHPCERKLWYDFRWCTNVVFDADTLKRFEDGHRSEDLQAQRLRMVEGVQLATHKHDGTQYGFELFGGHFQGHYDGIIMGILQAPKTPHIWEHKATNDSKFGKLIKLKAKNEKEALASWDEIYYAQAILYMKMEGLKRHYLTCSTPGGRQTTSVRTNENPVKADELIDKAERIINRDKPPVKLSNDPAFHTCKWCDHYDICHQRKVPAANCRNCVWSIPSKDDSSWVCRKHGTVNPMLCESHIYIPEVMPYDQVGHDTETQSVIYKNKNGKTFKNGPKDEDSYLSTELEALPEDLIGDIQGEAFRNEMGATVITDDMIPF